MTIGDFEQQVKDAVSLFSQYSDLSKKYLAFMRIGNEGLE